MTSVREKLADLLGAIGGGSFAARRTADLDDLEIEVEGEGRLRLPVTGAQAARLCALARPAHFGRGEKTLLDRDVRDTWEVPKHRVKVDRRRWNRALTPALEELRADLGFPEGSRLRADLHSMLVYAPGQFFRRHQDSEKTDGMVATLVVTLPSSFRGGALVIEHRGERVTFRGSKEHLSLVAFYADCHHEIRPVTQGHRITLTYNLTVEEGAATGRPPAEADPATETELADLLTEYFETPGDPRYSWQRDKPREPPDRLVFLLDHQYTERGLGWQRLKGEDAARVAALRAAAERAGCEAVLALAEIQETWHAYEEGWDDPWRRESHRWERDEYGEWYEDEDEDDEPPPTGPDRYDLVDLIESGMTLGRWIDASGRKTEQISTRVGEEEVCQVTPTSELPPYASEYEGYMGNYGNTMDRWYRRAAVVLWPLERAFAVRAEASPAWALAELGNRVEAGEIAEAREGVAAILPDWAVQRSRPEGLFADAARIAHGIDSPELAASLLGPFRIEAIGPEAAPVFVSLVARYGEEWTRSLLAEWSADDPRRYGTERNAAREWLASLVGLVGALDEADRAHGQQAARLLLEDRWIWLDGEIVEARRIGPPTLRAKVLANLAAPLLGWLEAAAVAEVEDLRAGAVTVLCAPENDALLPCLMEVLRSAAEEVPRERRAALGFEVLARHCADLLEAGLALPPRDADDWSIALPPGCECELCVELADFLADAGSDGLEWPIAKEKRKHVHSRLDGHGLPVRHETRRTGSPYTLVLTKTRKLFEREAAERKQWRADLAWLSERL